MVGDTDQRSCVIILTATLQPLRHALWCNYDAPALADRKGVYVQLQEACRATAD